MYLRYSIYYVQDQTLVRLSAIPTKTCVYILIYLSWLYLLSPSEYLHPKECKCLYVVLLMAFFWFFQVIPIVVTAFIPLVLFPLFEIQSTSQVSPNYLTASNSLFLAGLIFAIAVEDSGLDKRIAITFLNVTGPKPKRLLFGIMAVTGFLSLLVSNTATTAMMIPVLKSILDSTSIKKNAIMQEKYTNGLLLAVAYSSNIGGTGFLTGSPPNLVAPALLEKKFGSAAGISFIKWAMFAIPLMLVNLCFAGIWLYFSFGFSKYEKAEIVQVEEKKSWAPSLIFPGWSNLFPEVSVASSTPAFLMIIIMFLIPRKFVFWPFIKWNDIPQSSEALITWKAVEKKLPWGIMFLLGGGTAMAEGTIESGLSKWLVKGLRSSMSSITPWVINLIFCFIMTFGTEFMSNTAAASIMVPILVDLSTVMCESPLYFVTSTVICSSYAFMVPVATAPNALVYDASSISQFHMMKIGFVMNIICIITTTIAINLYGGLVFTFSPLPEWMMEYYRKFENTHVTKFIS
ncbi:SLC13A2_3_5 [Lepeophtheirus salmonis]|uniref:SLC13A2_3_5 n=1 Tax=Lepeophtheirus salmonis TaxID=72036 RepID=A0A7R8CDE5_LEPSM|nr:SLC13A2_3_5 [Lepeophtheirus salmonis]CAF2780305.1 SLC13A2_3_5 [Lepeophtheirus salmonis]